MIAVVLLSDPPFWSFGILLAKWAISCNKIVIIAGGWPQFRHIGGVDLELGSYFDFAFDLGVPHVRPAQRANVGIFARFFTICSCFPLVLGFPLPHHT
jgi:hypothetical protein